MKKLSLIILVLVFALTGCKTKKTLYHHGTYNENVYQYFKADEIGVPEQITQLEGTIQNAENKNLPIAPGILAHLGYLHLIQGNKSAGFEYLEKEKQLYPESKKYIQFLIKNAQGEKK